jgi:hypothetical protein
MAKDSGWVSDKELDRIREIIETVRYGSVNIIVQDGRIVQIDKNEKIRLTENAK